MEGWRDWGMGGVEGLGVWEGMEELAGVWRNCVVIGQMGREVTRAGHLDKSQPFLKQTPLVPAP